MRPWKLNEHDAQLLHLVLEEDLGAAFCDLTTDFLFKQNLTQHGVAQIKSKQKESIVMCGTPVIQWLLDKVDPACHMQEVYAEGDAVPADGILMTLTGPICSLLKLERTILNVLQRLCSVATTTQKFVARIAHTRTQILDTRKTFPGFRHLDKYAVLCGKGVNHRMGLYDAVMIKDTHVDALGSMARALNALPEDVLKHYPVIVEVRNAEELSTVLAQALSKVSRVLLDNMSLAQLQASATRCKGIIQTEASGNVTLDTVASIAETGVDFISIGRLTHSVENVDLSMCVEKDVPPSTLCFSSAARLALKSYTGF